MTDTRTLTVTRSTSTAHRLLNYDGACNNIHGHNLEWTVHATVDMADAPEGTNMPVDLKSISDVIDRADHTTLLNSEDPLVGPLSEVQEVWTVDGDPTCEAVADLMAATLLNELPVVHVVVDLAETDTYTVTAERGAR